MKFVVISVERKWAEYMVPIEGGNGRKRRSEWGYLTRLHPIDPELKTYSCADWEVIFPEPVMVDSEIEL